MRRIVYLSSIALASSLFFLGCEKESQDSQDSEKEEKTTIAQNGSENGYQYIELGLSVRWATFNVGATKPEEYGDYFAWGEIKTRDTCSWSTYKWCNGSKNTITKYSNNSSYGYDGFTDTLTVLILEDDVAQMKWGGSWRLPTEAELNELRNNCTWTWYSNGNSEYGGVAGYKVTSNKAGYTDRSIFLPAAGCRYDSDLESVSEYGNYWSSSLLWDSMVGAWKLCFDLRSQFMSGSSRSTGLSVRPVCP